MITLNKSYSTKALAQELKVSYDRFRKYRKEYEEHLAKFYQYNVEQQGKGIYYIFLTELYDYVPYQEYKAMKKSQAL